MIRRNARSLRMGDVVRGRKLAAVDTSSRIVVTVRYEDGAEESFYPEQVFFLESPQAAE